MSSGDWDRAPEGAPLDVGACGATDADNQGCARGLFHRGQRHQHTGLREWLATTAEDTIIRCYPGDRADELEAMESPLFAAAGFVPVASRSFEHVTRGSVGVWRLFGDFLRIKNVSVVRSVCYSKRPPFVRSEA